VVDRWGERVLDGSGEVDRKAIGAIVFADRDELFWLESIIHPRTGEARRAWLESVDAPLAVIEIPLLYETGADELFDAVVVITAPAETRAARTSVDDLAEREARLIPDTEKVARADFAYVNDGTTEELDRFVANVVEQLT
jgi:dephospho-CoA kinase